MNIPIRINTIYIREVWNGNLEREFDLIKSIVDDYPYVGMDTEFPGSVAMYVGDHKIDFVENLDHLRVNVDLLKLIQVGLTFSKKDGTLPSFGTKEKNCIWQFNFREFNPENDVYARESIELLRNSGIDFERNKERGVDVNRFAGFLFTSGIVMNDDVRFLTFHGMYDFGYLSKALTRRDLPDNPTGFFELLRFYFPVIYDIKYLTECDDSLDGGLDKLAKKLKIKRVGTSHQAASDSLLTSRAFFELERGKDKYFRGSVERFSGVLYGLILTITEGNQILEA